MTFEEALKKACEQPTLLDALNWVAVWECERAIQQAKQFFETGERTGTDGQAWDTCFKFCLEKVMAEYPSG